jgi:hypothetical protein
MMEFQAIEAYASLDRTSTLYRIITWSKKVMKWIKPNMFNSCEKCNKNYCESRICSVTGFQDLWLTGSVTLFDVGGDDHIGYYIWLFPCSDKLENFKSMFSIQNYSTNLTIFRPTKGYSNLFFDNTSIISVANLWKVPTRRRISHIYPMWLWGHSLFKISSPGPVLYGTKWLLWHPLNWSPTFHSECRINKGLSYRGSTIDHWKSLCRGQILWPTPYTYIHYQRRLDKMFCLTLCESYPTEYLSYEWTHPMWLRTGNQTLMILLGESAMASRGVEVQSTV